MVVKSTQLMTDYVETYWRDFARYWTPSTQKRNRDAWKHNLEPFGRHPGGDLVPADITAGGTTAPVNARLGSTAASRCSPR